MSKSKDTTKMRFLDKLFEEKEEPVPMSYSLMTDRRSSTEAAKNTSKTPSIHLIYIVIIIFLISSLIYLIYFNDYSSTLQSFITLIFVILIIGLVIDYFYLKRYKLIYAKVQASLRGDKKKDDDIDNYYHLLDI
jgi:cytochrome c oxidase subunit IV